jgi:beta-fructofuranosidase
MYIVKRLLLLTAILLGAVPQTLGRELTPESINKAIAREAPDVNADPMRPAFHLTPPAGCMGDPNGGIYHDGWYHIFYGLNPFAHHPGGWYWAHARSKDLLRWEPVRTGLTPALELGLHAIGSGSTIITADGARLAFYSEGQDGEMKFWRAQFDNDTLSSWKHAGKNPILTLDHPGLPPFHSFWRDPFVFAHEGHTYLIACADLLDEDYVPVPIFEAQDAALTDWDYKGLLFTYPKHKARNFEVPELRPLGDKWIFLASTDAPVDRCHYFIGDFDPETLTFAPSTEGILDYSGHYYAQETILNDSGELYVMAWMPGWDRDWLPTYMNEPLKNSSEVWNGCFALPRKLTLGPDGQLVQQPVESLKQLRGQHTTLQGRDLPVKGPTTEFAVLQEIRGDRLELALEFDLHAASMCGVNVLCNASGKGGLFINWSGNKLNVDGVIVPFDEWRPDQSLSMRIFVDKMFVEVFINGGTHCVSRQVPREDIKGDYVAITSLGGTARLTSLEAWQMASLNPK